MEFVYASTFCNSLRVKIRRFTSRVLRRLLAFEDYARRIRTSVFTTSLTLGQQGNSMSLTHLSYRNSFSRRCCCESDNGRIPHALKPATTLEGLSMMALLHAVLTKQMAVLRLTELRPHSDCTSASRHRCGRWKTWTQPRLVAAGGEFHTLGGAQGWFWAAPPRAKSHR